MINNAKEALDSFIKRLSLKIGLFTWFETRKALSKIEYTTTFDEGDMKFINDYLINTCLFNGTPLPIGIRNIINTFLSVRHIKDSRGCILSITAYIFSFYYWNGTLKENGGKKNCNFQRK